MERRVLGWLTLGGKRGCAEHVHYPLAHDGRSFRRLEDVLDGVEELAAEALMNERIGTIAKHDGP